MVDKTELTRALAEKYTVAWCSQNAASVASCYEENGSLTVNDDPPAVGRTAITKRAEAVDKIKELEEKYSRKEAIGQYLAAIYVGLGDKDKAFEWLEKDFQARNGKLAEIRWQAQFESLRDDPRFKDLIKRMGL